MRKRRLLNEVHCGIYMDQIWIPARPQCTLFQALRARPGICEKVYGSSLWQQQKCDGNLLKPKWQPVFDIVGCFNLGLWLNKNLSYNHGC